MVWVVASKIEELTLDVDGVRVFARRVQGDGVPAVYVHGNPTHSAQWQPFLRPAVAAVAVDLPGWGRSDRPAGFDGTMRGLSEFHDRCLEQLGVGKRDLIVHDWGALALIGAQQEPELVRRLVMINPVPLLPGYRWHWAARLWRRRGVGEALNRTTTRAGLALLLRQARGDRGPMPDEFVEMIWSCWDRRTSAAILQLYRDADPDRLAAAGRDLGRLGCPALVLWGGRDRYLPARFAHRYAEALGEAEAQILPRLGHWPWVEDPGVIDRVLGFIAGEDPAPREPLLNS
jgi:pimeloyl-ACP methyl ester carboxylesterase